MFMRIVVAVNLVVTIWLVWSVIELSKLNVDVVETMDYMSKIFAIVARRVK